MSEGNMRKMKDSVVEWIGEIPEDWDIVRVSAIADKTSYSIVDGPFGSDLKNEEYVDEGVKIVQLNNIKPFNHCLNKTICVTNEKAKQLSRHIAKSGDIVVAKMMPAGRACILSGDNEEYVVCADVIKIAISDEIKKKFLLYALNSYGMVASDYMAGGTTRTRINVSALRKMGVALPQTGKTIKSIVNYLDEKCAKLDSVIEKQRASIEELKAYKQAVITEAVTKGLNPDVEMKDSGVEWIGEIPKDWNVIKMKYLLIMMESGVSVNAGQSEAIEGELGVLKTSCVSHFLFDVHENKSVNRDEENRVNCPVTKNTIIVSRMNTPELVGACGYVSRNYDNIFLPDRLWQVHFKDTVNVKYIWNYLRSKVVRNHISSLSTGTSSSMQNISQGQFENIIIPLPSLDEQNEIVNYLDKRCVYIENTLERKQQQIKKLVEYKKSLIYEVVTGKKEVA